MAKKTIKGILNLEQTSNPAQKTGDLFVDQNNNLVFDDLIIDSNTEELVTQAFLDASTNDVTDLLFSGSIKKSTVEVLIQRGVLFQGVTLEIVLASSGWQLSTVQSLGDVTGVTFSITAGGQVQYTATSTGTSGTLTFKKSLLSDTTVKVVSSLNITQQPTDVDVDTVISPAITVQVLDQFGAILDNGTIVNASIASGTGILSGTVIKAAVGGVVTFDDLQINAADTFTLQFSVGGINTTSSSFVVNAGANWIFSTGDEAKYNVTSTRIEKIATASWDGNALYESIILNGNYSVEFNILTSGRSIPDYMAIGFETGIPNESTSSAWNSMEYGVMVKGDSQTLNPLRYTSYTTTPSEGTTFFIAGDLVKIERLGNEVKLYKNGVLFHLFTGANSDLTGDYKLSVAVYGQNQGIENINIQQIAVEADSLVITTQPTIATINTNFTIEVSAFDSVLNAVDPNVTGNVTAEIWYDPIGTAVLGGTLTRPFINGIATFDNLQLDLEGVGYILKFYSNSIPDQPNLVWESLYLNNGTGSISQTQEPNSIVKTSGGGAWNVNCKTNEEILSGEGYVEITRTSISDDNVYIGFQWNDLHPTGSYQNLNYAFGFGLGVIYRMNSGSFASTGISTSIGDVVRIAIEGTDIVIRKNPNVENQECYRWSSPTITYPIQIGTTIYDNGDGFDNIVVSGTKRPVISNSFDVVLPSTWTTYTSSGNDVYETTPTSIFKVAGTNSWNNLSRLETISIDVSNDVYMKCRLATGGSSDGYVGLTNDPTPTGGTNLYSLIDHGFYWTGSRTLFTRLNAANGTTTQWKPGDELGISITNSGSVINYYQNGQRIRQVTGLSITGTWYFAVSFLEADCRIDNISLGTLDTTFDSLIFREIWGQSPITTYTDGWDLVKGSGTISGTNNEIILPATNSSYDLANLSLPKENDWQVEFTYQHSSSNTFEIGITTESIPSTYNIFPFIYLTFNSSGSRTRVLGADPSIPQITSIEGLTNLTDSLHTFKFEYDSRLDNLSIYKDGSLYVNFGSIKNQTITGISGPWKFGLVTSTMSSPSAITITDVKVYKFDNAALTSLPSIKVGIANDQGFFDFSNSSSQIAVSIGNDGAGSGTILSGTTPKTVVNGIATFDNISLDQLGTNFTLNFDSGILPTLSTSSFDIVQTPEQMAFVVQPSNTVAGVTMTSFTVEVQDSQGNNVLNYTKPVTISINDPISGITGTLTKNAVDGIVTFDDIILTKARTGYILTASSSNLSTNSSLFDTSANTKSKLAFGSQPRNTPVNSTMPPFTVEIQDTYGNVTNDTDSITISLVGTSGITGTLSKSAINGVATFDNIVLDTQDNGFYFTATATGFTSVNSLLFDIIGPVSLVSGNFDLSFNADTSGLALVTDTAFTSTQQPAIYGATRQSDGKIILYGKFNYYRGQRIPGGIIRFNTDGSVDTTFQSNIEATGSGLGATFTSQPYGAREVLKLTLMNHDSQEKLLFSLSSGANWCDISDTDICRLNADGTFDSSFNTNYKTGGSPNGGNIIDFTVGPDSSIYIAHSGNTVLQGVTTGPVYKLNADGTLDTVWTGNVSASGTTVSTINSLAVNSISKLTVVGSFSNFNGIAVNRIIRFNANGTHDTDFQTNIGTGPNSSISNILIDSNDNIYLYGGLTIFNGGSTGSIFKLDSTGIKDTTFITNSAFVGNVSTKHTLFSDNTIGGWTSARSPFRLLSDGTLNATYATSFPFYANTCDAHSWSDGVNDFIFAAKKTSGSAGALVPNYTGVNFLDDRFLITNADNYSINNTFSNISLSFGPTANDICSLLITSNNEKFVIASTAGKDFRYNGTGFIIQKIDEQYNTDKVFFSNLFGTGNPTVFTGGQTNTKEWNGKLVHFGNFQNLGNVPTLDNLVVSSSDGIIDNNFHSIFSCNNQVNQFIPLQDGTALITGNFTQVNGTDVGRLAKINSDGTLDNTFTNNFLSWGDGSGFSNDPIKMTVAPNGSIYIYVDGATTSLNGTVLPGTTVYKYIRLTSEGFYDATFNIASEGDGSGVNRDPLTTSYPAIESIVALDDNTLLVAHSASNFNYNGTTYTCKFIVFNYDGTLNTSAITAIGVGPSIALSTIKKSKIANKLLCGGDFTFWSNPTQGSITVDSFVVLDTITWEIDTSIVSNMSISFGGFGNTSFNVEDLYEDTSGDIYILVNGIYKYDTNKFTGGIIKIT